MKAIMIYSKFIRENYSYLIVSTLILGILIGLFTSSPGVFIRNFSVQLIVAMVSAMGFTITFKRLGMALKDWKSTSLGMMLNFLFSPLICWLVAFLLLSNYPDVAVGLILIGVVPCAGMALVWTGLLEGDVSIASVIEVATMISAPFLIPVLMFLLAGLFVKIDAIDMFKTVMYTVLIPILGGIALRELAERKGDVKNYVSAMPAISGTIAMLLMFMAVNTTVPMLAKNLQIIAPLIVSTGIFFPLMFSVAYISTRFLPKEKKIAITYSSGMKNLPIALGIATLGFSGMTMLPIAIGFAFQMLTAVSFYQIFKSPSVLDV